MCLYLSRLFLSFIFSNYDWRKMLSLFTMTGSDLLVWNRISVHTASFPSMQLKSHSYALGTLRILKISHSYDVWAVYWKIKQWHNLCWLNLLQRYFTDFDADRFKVTEIDPSRLYFILKFILKLWQYASTFNILSIIHYVVACQKE